MSAESARAMLVAQAKLGAPMAECVNLVAADAANLFKHNPQVKAEVVRALCEFRSALEASVKTIQCQPTNTP